MSALPYMPLYVADYLADTAHLGAVEHGAYLLLIMNYWQRGKPLPADDVRLARIARVDASQWPSVRAQIERQKRLRSERLALDQRTLSERSANAQRMTSVRSSIQIQIQIRKKEARERAI